MVTKGTTKKGVIEFLGLGRLGWALLILSIILIASVAYFTPTIEIYLQAEILMEGKTYANTAIRLYAGFLTSSIMTLTAQLILWIMAKGVMIGQDKYYPYLDDVKTVRNFSVYALAVLAALLYLIAGKSVVRV